MTLDQIEAMQEERRRWISLPASLVQAARRTKLNFTQCENGMRTNELTKTAWRNL